MAGQPVLRTGPSGLAWTRQKTAVNATACKALDFVLQRGAELHHALGPRDGQVRARVGGMEPAWRGPSSRRLAPGRARRDDVAAAAGGRGLAALRPRQAPARPLLLRGRRSPARPRFPAGAGSAGSRGFSRRVRYGNAGGSRCSGTERRLWCPR